MRVRSSAASASSAFSFSACAASSSSLRNRVYLGEVPFRGVWYIGNQLGQDAQHLHHHQVRRGGGVEGLGGRAEGDPGALQLFDAGTQLSQIAAQAIDPARDEICARQAITDQRYKNPRCRATMPSNNSSTSC